MKMSKEIELKQDHDQVCVWLATVIQNAKDPMSVEDFEDYMLVELDYRVQYMFEYKTLPDNSGEGGRNDVVFALHNDDVNRMMGDRLIRFGGDIKWYNDYKNNYGKQIPSKYRFIQHDGFNYSFG